MRKDTLRETLLALRILKYDYSSLDDCLFAIKDKDPKIRLKALEYVSKRHVNRITDLSPFISLMLLDLDLDVQLAALKILSHHHGDDVKMALKEAFSFREESIREAAAIALCEYRDPSVHKFILDSLPSFSENCADCIRQNIDMNLIKSEPIFNGRSSKLKLPAPKIKRPKITKSPFRSFNK